jgi:hypothetical protein
MNKLVIVGLVSVQAIRVRKEEIKTHEYEPMVEPEVVLT